MSTYGNQLAFYDYEQNKKEIALTHIVLKLLWKSS